MPTPPTVCPLSDTVANENLYRQFGDCDLCPLWEEREDGGCPVDGRCTLARGNTSPSDTHTAPFLPLQADEP